MDILESEKELFDRWENPNVGFIRDGMVNEIEWKKSNLKVLYILKEANDSTGGHWDLRDFILKGARPQTWDNIARWTFGIMNIDKEIAWNDIKTISKDFRKDNLISICAVNLKKSPGGHTTNSAILKEHAKQDNKYLNEQFTLYSDVDIIICCGADVSDLFHSYVNVFPKFEWKNTSRGIKYHQIGINKYLFNYLHPEARVGRYHNILFYGLIDSIKEAFAESLSNPVIDQIA